MNIICLNYYQIKQDHYVCFFMSVRNSIRNYRDFRHITKTHVAVRIE